ncbi:hypothetical protein JAAARDRAFT_33876 [Jaapia argillacea MUCL 33604]|uniref:Uncharacterized protein n=1 Tax=Jaapia argillacea MUCL 33604 TaxID=933084 RepID=A0A067PWQ5_9AGAM|nr:hypothetical protein JAAARDRAFT_33876 [Jaapia argillacea MUCL 33604]
MPPATLPIFAMQFSRGKEEASDYHWNLTIITDSATRTGIVHQVTGCTYCYGYERNPRQRLEHSPQWRGSLHLGSVPKDRLNEIERILESVPIDNSDPQFNCQVWTFLAVARLRQMGFGIAPGLTMLSLRSKLSEVNEAWQSGDI